LLVGWLDGLLVCWFAGLLVGVLRLKARLSYQFVNKWVKAVCSFIIPGC
jgi:hypothetical protein